MWAQNGLRRPDRSNPRRRQSPRAHLLDENAARAQHERPDSPHCRSECHGHARARRTRPGLYQCNDEGMPQSNSPRPLETVIERSKVPLNNWLSAAHYLVASSKKGISAHQRRIVTLGVTYKSAWFMAHRLREAMRIRTPRAGRGHASISYKAPVVTLVERNGGGRVRRSQSPTITRPGARLALPASLSLKEFDFRVRARTIRSITALASTSATATSTATPSKATSPS